MAWENCNYYHYLRKLSGQQLPSEPSFVSPAIGTVFDICCKSWFATHHKLPIDRKALWENVNVAPEHSFAIKEGRDLFKKYVRSHAFPKDSITNVDFVDPPVCQFKISPTLVVPIFGYLDAAAGLIPFDWKTTGYNSSYQKSPTPGYNACYDLDNNVIWKGKHKRNGEPLDHLNRRWAIQCLFYSWMLGNEACPAGIIHELIYRPNDVLCATFMATISDEFIDEIKQKLGEMWEQSQTGLLPEPYPSAGQCHQFGRVCNASHLCEFYQEEMVD